MSNFFSTGLSIPADKRDLFTLKFESALLRYNVRAYFGPINTNNFCPIKLNHLSLKTPGPLTTAWDLKMAKKLLQKGLKVDRALMTSDLNQIKSHEVITLDDSGVSTETMPPEIIELDSPSPVQHFDLIKQPDISVVNLVDDSFSSISTDRNNDSDIQIVTVKINSPVKRIDESDVIVLSSNVKQVNKKHKIDQNKEMQIDKLSVIDLSDISASSSGYGTPVEFVSENSVDKRIFRVSRNRNRPLLQKVHMNGELQSEASSLRDLSNISSSFSTCSPLVEVVNKNSVKKNRTYRVGLKNRAKALFPKPNQNLNNLNITFENKQERVVKKTHDEADKIEEVDSEPSSLRCLSYISTSSSDSMPVGYVMKDAVKKKKKKSRGRKISSNRKKLLKNMNNSKINISSKNSSNQSAVNTGQTTPSNLNNFVGETININSQVKRKAESDFIVLSSNVKQVKKKRKLDQHEEVQINKLSLEDLDNISSSSGYSTSVEFVSGNSVQNKVLRGKICNLNLEKSFQNLNLKIAVSPKKSLNQSARSAHTIQNNLKDVGGGKAVFRRSRGQHVTRSKAIKDQTPGTSKPSNYYDLVNEAVDKLRKSPRLSKRFLQSSPKSGSVRTRHLTQQSPSSVKPFRPQPTVAYGDLYLPRHFDNKNIFYPNPFQTQPVTTYAGSLRRRQFDNKNIFNPKPVEVDPEGLRPIIIDGSNIAFLHGRNDKFSAEGVKICVDYFHQRGHREIKVFFPQHIEPTIGPALISDLDKKCSIIFTPSRQVNGVRKTPYDDRFIVQYAVEVGGVIVSRDMYRDLKEENQRWKNAIDQRLLMPTFADDYLIFPVDPLGKSGPTLDQLLKF